MQVALVGNPNVGKSTVFNGLTGMNQHTGNWPGKTVGVAMGTFADRGTECTLVDLPGTYSLRPSSAEEKVTRDYLVNGQYDRVVIVCDASCLERNLILALQVINMCHNSIVCVNLMDEATARGVRIDLKKLSRELGVPVVGITARNPADLRRLKNAILSRTSGSPAFSLPPEDEKCAVIMAEGVAAECVEFTEAPDKKDRKIDKLLTGKFTGLPIMLLMLAVIFWLTIQGSNYPSQWLSNILLGAQDNIYSGLLSLHLPDWLCSLLADGCWRTVAWVVSVMLPPMLIFFPLFTFLEDLGYLPRVAFNLDKFFKACGTCGKQALTMCQGLGCNAVGVTGCRIIDSPRERLIAIITNCFLPCNGRFPAMLTLIGCFMFASSAGSALTLTAVIVFGILMTFLVSAALSKTILKGETTTFTLELPPYRKPQLGKIIIRSICDRGIFVLGRAITAAAPAGILIWILANISVGGASLLSHAASFLEPAGRLMGLDGVILLAFILGLPASEIVIPIMIMAYTASGSLTELTSLEAIRTLFADNGWTWLTALNTVIFFLLHWPCATTIMTIKKETGSVKWTLAAIFIPAICGGAICVITNLLSKLFSLI